MSTQCDSSDLIVFSHLRWDFVFQRPQHILSRHAQHRRVFYVEEPVFGMTKIPTLHMRESTEGVQIVVPYLPEKTVEHEIESSLKNLIDEMIMDEDIKDFSVWYYTPMAMMFTRHLKPLVTIFDCMDELSLFKGASENLIQLERDLLSHADLVFTGGQSLYEAKKEHHHNIHAMPSSIDYKHFAESRLEKNEPLDQLGIAHPRIGFYGVIDERFDIDLLAGLAAAKPDYQFVIIGPVVKISEESLPRRNNIHYLGKKEYAELPFYLSGWDCAMMPFARNDSTKFISPTKTPEFLAAGRPVVSTSITDVIDPYANKGLVYISDDAQEFVQFIDEAMKEKIDDPDWILRVDKFLRGNSWDETFSKMAKLELDVKMKKRFINYPQMLDQSMSMSGAI